MENPNIQSPSLFNKRFGRYGSGNEPLLRIAYNAMNGNLAKFEAVQNNGTAFAPNKCFYQKVAAGMENPNMQPLLGAINVLGTTARETPSFIHRV